MLCPRNSSILKPLKCFISKLILVASWCVADTQHNVLNKPGELKIEFKMKSVVCQKRSLLCGCLGEGQAWR